MPNYADTWEPACHTCGGLFGCKETCSLGQPREYVTALNPDAKPTSGIHGPCVKRVGEDDE